MDGDHSRPALGPGPPGHKIASPTRRSPGIFRVSQRVSQIARGGITAVPIVHGPLSVAPQYKFGRRSLDVGAGEATFVARGPRYSVHTRPVAGSSGPWFIRTLADVARIPAGTSAQTGACRGGGTGIAGKGTGRHRRRGARSAALGRARPLGQTVDRCPSARGRYTRAPERGGVAGVGGRCLKNTFLDRRGSSPIRCLIPRRLEAIRARLPNAEGGVEVTSVALACGLTHMGRFSNMCRQAFGESPSTTLRRKPTDGSRKQIGRAVCAGRLRYSDSELSSASVSIAVRFRVPCEFHLNTSRSSWQD
jgi:AraC-like DNA-binding protein